MSSQQEFFSSLLETSGQTEKDNLGTAQLLNFKNLELLYLISETMMKKTPLKKLIRSIFGYFALVQNNF